MEGVHVVGNDQGSGDVSPVGFRGKGPVEVLWDEVPQKLKKNVKLEYKF